MFNSTVEFTEAVNTGTVEALQLVECFEGEGNAKRVFVHPLQGQRITNIDSDEDFTVLIDKDGNELPLDHSEKWKFRNRLIEVTRGVHTFVFIINPIVFFRA